MTRPRRRSSIIPEILYGDSNGVGELRIGARYQPRMDRDPLMTWDYLQKVVTSDDLDKLIRDPECEEEYIQWAKGIKSHYGGLETYISQERLGWDKKDLPLVESNANPTQFLNDEIMQDLSNIKVVFNDWPYGIPFDCKHHVVWCKYPIISPALLESKDSPFPPSKNIREVLYKAITADGIRGESGNVTKRLPVIGDKSTKIIEDSLNEQEIQESILASSSTIADGIGPTGLGPAADLAELAHLWSGRFAKKFICQFWNPQDYETVFFCNPLHLRTVPGISHFHVISRKKKIEEK